MNRLNDFGMGGVTNRCPSSCMCGQEPPQNSQKKYFSYKASTPPHMKPVTFEPCVHLHFKSEHVDRECLTKEQYYDLLATPKGYPWLGEADCQNPELEKNKPKKKKKRDKATRGQCEYESPTRTDAGDFAEEFVEDMWDVMSPEITCRLIDFLVNEFGMSIEEAEDFIDCKSCVGKQPICKKKKSKSIIGLGPKNKWVKEFSDVFSKRIEQYIISMLMTRRTPRTKKIAEKILASLCDLTGEKTSLQNPRTKTQKVMVLVADRLALWIDNMMTDIDKPQKKRISITEQGEEEPSEEEGENEELVEKEGEKPQTPQKEKDKKEEKGDAQPETKEEEKEKMKEKEEEKLEEKEGEKMEEKGEKIEEKEDEKPVEEEKPETETQEEPEPVKELKPEPEKQAETEAEPKKQSEPEAETENQPESEPEKLPEPQAEPEPVKESEPEPEGEQEAAPIQDEQPTEEKKPIEEEKSVEDEKPNAEESPAEGETTAEETPAEVEVPAEGETQAEVETPVDEEKPAEEQDTVEEQPEEKAEELVEEVPIKKEEEPPTEEGEPGEETLPVEEEPSKVEQESIKPEKEPAKKSYGDIFDLVKEDIAGTPKDRRTDRQKADKEEIGKRIEKLKAEKDLELRPEDIDDTASRVAHWMEHVLGPTELKTALQYKKPPPAFVVKRQGGSKLEVHKLSSGTVAKETAQVRGVKMPMARKVPETSSPMNFDSAQEWVDWASNIANMADEWGQWLEGTLTDAEKQIAAKKQKDSGIDWSQYKNKTQNEAQKWRVERGRIKDEGKVWDRKIDKKLQEQTEIEVRSTDM